MDDRWTDAADDDDDLEVFVIGGDDATVDTDGADGPVPDLPVDLPTTISSEDVAGDDWADTAWLDQLDDPLSAGEEVVAAVDVTVTAPRSAGPGDPAGDRMDEVLRTIGTDTTDDRTDVQALLRELSMLVVDD